MILKTQRYAKQKRPREGTQLKNNFVDPGFPSADATSNGTNEERRTQ